MKQKITSLYRATLRFIAAHKKLAFGLPITAGLLLAAILISSTIIIESYGKYVLATNTNKHVAVGIVLGAGVTKDGKPFKELQARLDVAAEALQKGTIDTLILSGDNRFKQYNEPGAMVRYLTDVKHIPSSKLQPDYAGRSTYESCERASKVFGLKKTVLFSAESHLPRAIYLCRHFGVETYGIASHVEADGSGRRELLARVKALYNVYIHGEKTVLGTPITVLSSKD